MRTLNLSLLAISACATAQVVFQTTYDGPLGAYDAGHGVSQTADGGFAVVGITSGNNVFDGSLVRFNADGDTLWSHQYDLGYFEYLEDVFQLPDGGFMLGGYAGYAGDNNGPLIIRTDASGDTLWTRHSTGESGYDQGSGMCRTSAGGAALTGEVKPGEDDDTDVVLRLFDAVGTEFANAVFGGPGDQQGRDIVQLPNGDFLIAGVSRASDSDSSQLMLVRTDASGAPVWTKLYGGSDDDRGNAVCPRNAGGFYVAGTTTDPITGDEDAWFLTLNEAGDTLGTMRFDNDSEGPGGTHPDSGTDVIECANGSVILLYNTTYDQGYRLNLMFTDNNVSPIYTFYIGEENQLALGYGLTHLANDNIALAAVWDPDFGSGTPQDLLLAEIEASCSIVGMPDAHPDALSIHCWPDPFEDRLTIVLPEDHGRASISIGDGMGRAIWNADGISGTRAIWNGAQVASGLYFVTILVDGHRHTQRVVKL